MENPGRVAILLTVVLAFFVVSACGVSKDEHQRTLAELEKTKTELTQAKAKIAGMEKAIKIPKIDTSIMEKLRSAQQKAGDLSAKVKSLTGENETLNENLAKLKKMMGDLQEKLKAFQGKTGGLPLDMFKNR
ncbi:hypothetical protein ACFL0H_11170 [Thermodesulfobacteriota bacterium]